MPNRLPFACAAALLLAVASCGGSSSPEPQAKASSVERFSTLASSYVAVDAAGSVYAIGHDAGGAAVFSLPAGAQPKSLASAFAANVLATDSAGNVYFSQFEACTMVGCSSPLFEIAHDATPALVPPTNEVDAQVAGVAFDGNGGLYLADFHGNRIWKVAGGKATVFAGPEGDPNELPSHRVYPCLEVDGTGTGANFCGPSGLAVDRAGNVYVADQKGDTIRRITPDGVVTTVAGMAFSAGSVDGPAFSATFNAPSDVAVDEQGDVYVADTGNALVRRISTTGDVTTLAGTRGLQGFTPGPLPGVIDSPGSIALHGTDLYFSMASGIGHIANAH